MADALDQKGLEAATDAYNEFECGSDVDHVRKIVRAYLSTVIPAEIARVVERLERLAGEMERHLGPPEMAPGPDADDLREAATLIERLAASQAAPRENVAHFINDAWGGYWQTVRDGKPYNFRTTLSSNAAQAEARRLALEEAAKVADRKLREYEDIDGPRQAVVASIRAIIDQPSTEGGKDGNR